MDNTPALPDPNAWTVELPELIAFYGGVVSRRRRLMAGTAAAFLALGVLYLLTTKRTYQGTSALMIAQQGARPISVPNDSNHSVEINDDYVPTQMQVAGSRVVIARAIASAGLDNLPTLRQAKAKGLDPVDEAAAALRVDRPDRMAKVVRLTYSSQSRAESVRTVQAIIDSYQQFLVETNQATNGKVVSLIAQARDVLNEEMVTLERDYLAFRQKNQTLVMNDKEGRSYMAQRLEQLDKAVNEARIKEIQLRTQLEVGRRLAKEGAGMWSIAHAMQKLSDPASGQDNMLVSGAAGMSQANSLEYVRILTQEQQQLAERFGPRNSRVQEIKEQIKRIQEGTRETRRGAELTEVRDLLGSVEESLRSISGMRAELKKEFDQGLKDAKQVETDLLAETNYRNNLDRQRLLFNTVVDQLRQAQFSGDYSTFTAQVVEAPRSPVKGYGPKGTSTLGVALILGLMAGVSAALVAERCDRRLGAGEIRRIFGANELAQIPTIPASSLLMIGDSALACQMLPRSVWAESYRLARTNLELLRRDRPAVIVVTSPGKGDGKSTTASNLAIVLALAGRRVLLVDGDLRRPCMHRLYGLPRAQGLVQVLTDQLSAARVIRRTFVASLDVVTSGPDVPSPAELLASPRLAEFLGEVRGLYDIILIDAPPVLSTADPSILGASADGILLVVRPDTLRRDARAAMDQLGLLGTPVIGTIVNGVALRPERYEARGDEESTTPAAMTEAFDGPLSSIMAELMSDGPFPFSELPGDGASEFEGRRDPAPQATRFPTALNHHLFSRPKAD